MNHAHDFLPARVVAELPPLNARFCVPRLADKPQNPIMETLKLLDDLKVPPVQSALLNRQGADRPAKQPAFDSFRADDAAHLWQRVCDRGLFHGVRSSRPKTWTFLTPPPDEPSIVGHMAALAKTKRDAFTIHFGTGPSRFCCKSPFVCRHRHNSAQ